MDQCPACSVSVRHTEKFDKIFSVIFNELNERKISGVEDVKELAMALSVFVADSLDIKIYTSSH